MRKTETGREKKTDTRRRKIPINWSPVCFKKRERETSAVGVHEGHPLKNTKQERSPDWVTDKNIAVLCCEEERAGGGGEREREGRALKGGRWRQVYGRPVAWRNPLNLLSLSHTHTNDTGYFLLPVCVRWYQTVTRSSPYSFKGDRWLCSVHVQWYWPINLKLSFKWMFTFTSSMCLHVWPIRSQTSHLCLSRRNKKNSAGRSLQHFGVLSCSSSQSETHSTEQRQRLLRSFPREGNANLPKKTLSKYTANEQNQKLFALRTDFMLMLLWTGSI